MTDHPPALSTLQQMGNFLAEVPRIGLWTVSCDQSGVVVWERAGLPIRVLATPDHATPGHVAIEVLDASGETLWETEKPLPEGVGGLKQRAESYTVLMTAVLAEADARMAYLSHVAGESLGDALPAELVSAITRTMVDRPQAVETFLSWDSYSLVGIDCLLIAHATQRFIAALGDAGDEGVIDTTPIWDAAAHQCTIYAFS